MALILTNSGYRKLALAIALAVPGLAVAQQGTPVTEALASFSAKAQRQSPLSAADVANPYVTSSYFDPSTGLTHTYLQQRVNGLTVFNANGAVHTDRSGKVVFFNQDFLPGAAAVAPSTTPTLTPEQAVVAAAKRLDLPRPVSLQRLVEARVADGIVFNKGGISEENIPVRLMYMRVDNKLVLVWNVTIAQLDQQHYWNARIDAQTGRFVDRNDYVVSERATFQQHVLESKKPSRQPMATTVAALAADAKRSTLGTKGTAAANSMTVIPVPFENPDISPRVVVPFSSANPLYSPYGWQVGEGKAPANFFADTYSLLSSGKQLTRGNNVAAYDDNATTTNGNGTLTSTTNSPDGGPTLNFDFPFNQRLGARNPGNVAAGITNLFYWNNMLHDVMMSKGFDEVSGNFQYKNITNLGRGNDFVRAESQDGSRRNNASFTSPPDGTPGLMQMYLWDNEAANTLTITAPTSAAGTYKFNTASFGPLLSTLPNGLCGDIVAVNDGVSADGGISSCATPYVNAAAIQGKIALIRRGGCNAPATNNFTDKVKFAQLNGAIGAIVYDSNPTGTTPSPMGGTDATVTIPAIGISGVDGERLRAALANNAVATGCATTGPDFDGSFDNGVVSHEYGHGISTRLTGGPANSNCLENSDGNQTMGEGWSDFFALWMTTRPGDGGGNSRYVGTYDGGEPYAVGPGFRNKPYSTDFAKNDYTYSQLGTAAGQAQRTHDVGEVWATVLWDLNWQFIYKYGYSADFFSANGGNNKMLKLVLDGLKLQVCNPGFLDGRDALLRADTVTNRAANADLIWNVFARRGMGANAVQGPRVNGVPTVGGVVQGFNLPLGTRVIALSNKNGNVVGNALEAYPNPAQEKLTVRTQLNSAVPMQVIIVDLLGKTVLRSVSVPAARMQQNGLELNTSSIATGVYVVRVTTSEGTFTTKVSIQH
ncbi:M36 family metallopeptidase [Hymenobacter arizonensis]|uniref:Por secretion system C-terminal sorting domain-containing protein n=1 Tax=Hymenobacter arizonensis TaxID=1227077 RepID=A0A1I6A945_HYMAR|nr:M36 family metallopeptidase [Hymenobacter arizonensis]SFQ65087.1 Por secretion system C-terminal sorting domain-containing protein [Hymenobacter arizonensis]